MLIYDKHLGMFILPTEQFTNFSSGVNESIIKGIIIFSDNLYVTHTSLSYLSFFVLSLRASSCSSSVNSSYFSSNSSDALRVALLL